jgi:hypothetical protein
VYICDSMFDYLSLLFGLEATPGEASAAASSSTSGGGGDIYETAYACEDSGLNITCGGGGRLNIIRANYGRFSIAICNVHGNTEWSVNCMSPRTLRVIRARCQGAPTCQVPVDSTIFGDPCPGTLKYVEVHYSCDLGELRFHTLPSLQIHVQCRLVRI